MYSSYCDCGKFVNWVDQPTPTDVKQKTATKNPTSDDPMQIDSENQDGSLFAWFISRGAEMCDVSDGVCKL